MAENDQIKDMQSEDLEKVTGGVGNTNSPVSHQPCPVCHKEATVARLRRPGGETIEIWDCSSCGYHKTNKL